ncbi:hypothetical protein B0H10DRAFT_1946383 [Mycena sp. CBHHK59/15]|nr:hypothetical protein B0H10DRAFT_1946383 [Mycena sp. CBHHK59/15]
MDVACVVDEAQVRNNINTAHAILLLVSFPRGVTGCQVVKAMLDIREGKNITARSEFQRLLTLSLGINEEACLLCLERLGDITHQMDSLQNARWAVIYMVSACKVRSRLAITQAIQCLGDIALAEEDEDTVLNLFELHWMCFQ